MMNSALMKKKKRKKDGISQQIQKLNFVETKIGTAENSVNKNPL